MTLAAWARWMMSVPVLIGCADSDPVGTSGTGSGGGAATTSSAPLECTGAETACDGGCSDLTSDPLNCGMCGRTCVVTHGIAGCAAGECIVDSCNTGFGDCNTDPLDGCELEIDCQEGGACMTTCGSLGSLACSDGCAPTCSLPAESCNGIDDDCDGACDQGALAGCRVAVHRAYNGTNGHLFTTDLVEAMNWGLEAPSFFYLYAGEAADLRPFFRCPKAGNGNFLFSDSTDCEGTAGPLFTVGFIAPMPTAPNPATCGAVPLYRIFLPANGWHFYTTSLAERDAAIAGGWVDQGLAGYVWTTP